jgi:hypothetical protein
VVEAVVLSAVLGCASQPPSSPPAISRRSSGQAGVASLADGGRARRRRATSVVLNQLWVTSGTDADYFGIRPDTPLGVTRTSPWHCCGPV